MSLGADLASGERVAEYVLEEPLGRGGFATVWRARGPHGLVALKFLEPRAAADTANAHRFGVELETLTKLRHSGIARCYGSLEHRGLPAIVMEYVEGLTLRADMLKRSQLGEYFAWTEISELITQVVGALSAAHRAGVVHRDLKPSNIILGHGDAGQTRVVLLDFGVAKLTGADHLDETTMGRPIGTLHYMAPEQHLSVGVGPAADIFAAGVLLFELCTLRRPWIRDGLGGLARYHDQAATSAEENNYAAILYRVSREARPSMSELRLDAPQGMALLVGAALNPTPGMRPATAEAFLERFDAALDPSRRAGSLEPPRAPGGSFEAISRTLPQPFGVGSHAQSARSNAQAFASPSLTPRVVPVELSDPDAEQVAAAIAPEVVSRPPPQARRAPTPAEAPAAELKAAVASARRWGRSSVLAGAASGGLGSAFVSLVLGVPWLWMAGLVPAAAVFGMVVTYLGLRLQRRRTLRRFRATLASSTLFRWQRKETPGSGFEFVGSESAYAKTSDSVHLTVVLRGSDPFEVAQAPIRVVIEKPARSDIRFLMRSWEQATGISLAPGLDGGVACPIRPMISLLVAEKLVIRDQDLKLLIRETLGAFAEEIVFTAAGIRLTIHVAGDVSAEHQVQSVYRACALFSSLYWWGETQGR